jgi:alpha-galactosidase
VRPARPLVLNTWEAVYFETDLDHLKRLADVAAEVGVERFVLDDGWFRHRRHDRAGLGDWYVDEGVWPHGLHPLVDHVRSLGMQMGLWFEPEMVNPDSDLVRAHPDWVLTPGAPMWRHQLVLDVANPDAYDYLLERISSLVTEYDLDYLKWDHNRDLHGPVHDGRPGVSVQTRAVYRLLDELKARHPGLEIESCASGGARVDLGILARTDRVWASDTNDAVERQTIQRWTGLLLPPELIGSHVGPPESHTTGRHVSLGMRLATSLFCHAGFEWDITTCSDEELGAVTRFAALYKELRPLLHSGDVVRADLPDPGALLHGVVALDRAEAVYAYIRVTTSPDAAPGLVRLPGLDPSLRYAVRVRSEVGDPLSIRSDPPGWWPAATSEQGFVVRGAVLGASGLAMPALDPATAVVLHLTSG